MALSAIALVSLAEEKAQLGITDAAMDAILEGLIDAVSAAFNKEVDFTLATTTYTNVYLDGNGRSVLYLPAAPVVGAIGLTEDGTTLTEGPDKDFLLYADEGKIVKVNGTWLLGPKTLKLTMRAGFECLTPPTTLPADIKQAAFKQVGYEYSRFLNKDWGTESRSIGDRSVSTKQVGLIEDVKAVLRYHRRFGL